MIAQRLRLQQYAHGMTQITSPVAHVVVLRAAYDVPLPVPCAQQPTERCDIGTVSLCVLASCTYGRHRCEQAGLLCTHSVVIKRFVAVMCYNCINSTTVASALMLCKTTSMQTASEGVEYDDTGT
eukprot:13718-Heterococcus_DN1.PRE.1